MNRNHEIATIILQQLGGKRFIVMTGAKDFTTIDNGLRFKIGRNGSKANMVEIKLNGLDLYDIEFIAYRPYSIKVDHKRCEVREIPEKREVIRKFDDCYCDMLQDIFTETTGFYTHF